MKKPVLHHLKKQNLHLLCQSLIASNGNTFLGSVAGFNSTGANNVFVGANSVILPSVKIGDNVIVGAGSIVVKDIPSNSIAVGNPCRVIKIKDKYIEDFSSTLKLDSNVLRFLILNKQIIPKNL